MWVWSLGWEDPLEHSMTTHSSILAWRIPWTEEPGGLQSIGWQRVRHDWSTLIMVSVCLPSMASRNTYGLTWVSLTLDVGYLFMAAPAKRSRCSLLWTRGISLPLPLLTLNVGVAPFSFPAPMQPPFLGHGVAPPGCCPWPRVGGSSSQPLLRCRSLGLSAATPDLKYMVAPLRCSPWPWTWGSSSWPLPRPRTWGSSSWPCFCKVRRSQRPSATRSVTYIYYYLLLLSMALISTTAGRNPSEEME